MIRQFAHAHLEQGHDVQTLTLDPPERPYLRGLPGQVYAVGTRSEGYGFSPAIIEWLRDRSSSFHAVIVHGLWQFHGAAVRWALRKSCVPYFVYPHGMLDPWFRSAYRLKHAKKAVYWRLVENLVLRDARAVLFTCEEERRLAQSTFHPYRCNERIAPLGISEPATSAEVQLGAFRERYPALRGKRILLFLGRLHHKKGCVPLIEAFSALRRQGGLDASYILVFAGPCADLDYLKQIQKFASETCPANSVYFLGMLEGDMKWGALRSADAFILPSHQENFGIAVVEALSMGVPVLISNKVNIWREIEHGEAGFIAPDGREGACELLENWQTCSPETKIAMRVNARRLFETHFEARQAARTLIRIVEENHEQ